MRVCQEMWLHSGMPTALSSRIPIVDIQNVQDYMAALEDGEDDRYWDAVDDFPIWASPWPIAVYEWTGRFPGGEKAETSVLYLSTRRDDRTFACKASIALRNAGVVAEVSFDLNPDGSIRLDENDLLGKVVTSQDIAKALMERGEDGVGFFHTMLPVGMATSFLGCKNVTIRDETPHLTRQQRRHGPPEITYKVLDIAPMTRVLRDEGDIEHNGLKKALHICRGHFAHYGPERKLFGKYEGTFWHPMHIRGGAEQGVVVKDYKVSPHGRG